MGGISTGGHSVTIDVPKAFVVRTVIKYGRLVVVTFRVVEFELCAKAEAVMIAVLEVELGVGVGSVVIGVEAGLAEVEVEGLEVETVVFA